MQTSRLAAIQLLLIIFSACTGRDTSAPPAVTSSEVIILTPTESPTIQPGTVEAVSPSPAPVATNTVTGTLSAANNPSTPPPQVTPPAQENSEADETFPNWTVTYPAWALVHSLAWSPDGRWLAVAAGDSVHIYQSNDWAETSTLNPGVWSLDLAFHPAATLLAMVLADGWLQVWDLQSVSLACQFQAHKGGANSLAFQPDGQMLATAGNDSILRLWDTTDLADGVCPPPLFAEIIGGAFAIPDAAFSPDGALLASIEQRSIYLREPTSQRLVRILQADQPMFSLAFRPDGGVLAAAETGNTARLWDVQSGDQISTFVPLRQSDAFIWSIAFNPDGSLLAVGSSDGGIAVWDMSSSDTVWSAQAHSRAISGLAFSPDGLWLASGGLDAALHLWPGKP
ncbi:MAG: PD40 domain-containing protein [Anaerolineales bacterium]|nr:PD40 domain-containing protein [Anaerolineales bacterium]